MRLAICGTYSSGKTITVMALSRLTGIPRVRARTMREIAPVAIPGRMLEECTAAELIEMITIRHVDRAVHESALGSSFLSDGTSLQEWAYGSIRVHVGINPNASAHLDRSEPVPRTPELQFFADVMVQLGRAMKRHVRASYDAFAHLAHELPMVPDGHRPVNDTFRAMADDHLLRTARELDMPCPVFSGSLSQRVAAIAETFALTPLLDPDEAIAGAMAEYAELDTRIESLRAGTPHPGAPTSGSPTEGDPRWAR